MNNYNVSLFINDINTIKMTASVHTSGWATMSIMDGTRPIFTMFFDSIDDLYEFGEMVSSKIGEYTVAGA